MRLDFERVRFNEFLFGFVRMVESQFCYIDISITRSNNSVTEVNIIHNYI